jgi:hypothetical protein
MGDYVAGKAAAQLYCAGHAPVPQGKRAPVFEPGYHDREGLFTFVRHPTLEDLTNIYTLSLQKIGSKLAPFEFVQSVYTHNPISFWGLYRSLDERRLDPTLAGYSSYLPLNDRGHAALTAGLLNPKAPELFHLAAAGEAPVALYMWAIVAPRMADLAGALIAYGIGLELYDRLPLYATISTEGGLRSLQKSRRSPLVDTATIGTFFQVRGSEEDRQRLFALEIHPGSPAGAPQPSVHGTPGPGPTLRPISRTNGIGYREPIAQIDD